MNERIKLLDKQAVDYALSVCDANGVYQGKEYLTVVKEKFAELIVHQMLQTCEDHPAWTGRMIGEQIKQEFGVLE